MQLCIAYRSFAHMLSPSRSYDCPPSPAVGHRRAQAGHALSARAAPGARGAHNVTVAASDTHAQLPAWERQTQAGWS